MGENRRSKQLHNVTIGDMRITTNLRISIRSGKFSITTRFTSSQHYRDQAINYHYNNRDQCITKCNQYYADNRDLQKSKQTVYNKAHPTINFLGKIYQMVSHSRPPHGYVWHHTCYDHADPEANIELVSMHTHQMGHRLLAKLGIKLQHINMEKL